MLAAITFFFFFFFFFFFCLLAQGGAITFTLHRTPGTHQWPTLLSLPPAGVGESMFGKKLFVIEVQRARGLEELAGVMKMRPFVVATTKPAKKILTRTSATEVGECDPKWSGELVDGLDNKLALKVDKKTTALVLEVRVRAAPLAPSPAMFGFAHQPIAPHRSCGTTSRSWTGTSAASTCPSRSSWTCAPSAVGGGSGFRSTRR